MSTSREKMLFEIFEDKLPQFYKTDEIRKSQVEMAFVVAEFLHPTQKTKKVLVIEAPVGTGKSLGALVPALIECSIERKFSNKRIVYATATINLQGQLMNSEVPLLKELSLLDTAILAKGKSHYYCHNEMIKSKLSNDLMVVNLSDFYNTGYTGQRDEFENNNGEIGNDLWDKVNLKGSKRDCERCVYSQSCPSILHRNRFLLEENELLITNHEQLIRSTLNRIQENPFPPIVPVNPGIIIIDEAHHFIENFLSQLEESISVRDLQKFGNHKRFPNSFRKIYLKEIDILKNNLIDEATKHESLQGRYPLTDFTRNSLEYIKEILSDSIDKIFVLNQANNTNRFDREDDFSNNLETAASSIRNLLDRKGHVNWISYEDMTFSSIPVNFPTQFKNLVKFLTRFNKIVVMSGTITTNGDFSSFINQWRLSIDDVMLKSITQSFDYTKQALIYVPEHVIDPRENDDTWIDDQVTHYNQMLTLTEGRTLILSTSKQHMENVSGSLKEICDSLNVTLLRQEQGGVEQLTKQFKNDETSVLLGSGSFFSGFSIPGPSLVSVIFSRLPFPVHEDPYLKLIGEGFEDVFLEEVILPNMMVKLNQGIGRLIRDINDYGIITILDPRIFNSKFSKLIRMDFEKKGYRFTRSINEVKQFYNDKIQNGSQAIYIPYSRNDIVVPDSLKEFGKGIEKKVKKEKVVRPKKHAITEEQIAFAQQICKERNVTLSKKSKHGEDLYKELIDLYFSKYHSIDPVRDHFPFKNQAQQGSVMDYTGSGSRSYQAKKCTDAAFGCSGNCNALFKEELAGRISSSGGNLDGVTSTSGFCWLVIKPFDENDEIMERCASLTEAFVT